MLRKPRVHGNDVDPVDKPESTPLNNAAAQGRFEVVEFLVDSIGVGIDDVLDRLGRTPLHDAAVHGHLKVVEFLVEKGANVNAVDKDGKTPLHLVVLRCSQSEIHVPIMNFLLAKGARSEASDRHAKTPLDIIRPLHIDQQDQMTEPSGEPSLSKNNAEAGQRNKSATTVLNLKDKQALDHSDDPKP